MWYVVGLGLEKTEEQGQISLINMFKIWFLIWDSRQKTETEAPGINVFLIFLHCTAKKINKSLRSTH